MSVKTYRTGDQVARDEKRNALDADAAAGLTSS
jgi:hypothetical protein